MLMWMIIMWTTLGITLLGLFYLCNRVSRFYFMEKLSKGKKKQKFWVSVLIVFGVFYLIGFLLNFMNAIVCVVYFAMIWLVCDFISALIIRYRKKAFDYYYAGISAIVLSIVALSVGWYLDYHVWQTDYTFTTAKLRMPLKIVMFADSHTGTTFHADGFAKHISAMQAQNPDVVIVAGDFVDDGTTRQDMIETCRSLGQMKTTYGVYFVFGNHDKGYYGPEHRGFSGDELVAELERNGVKVLRDETELVADAFYIIGRRDYSEVKEHSGYRKSMSDLVQNLDKTKYMIVADHQPTDYAKQTIAEVDLVLSGHTHGGQLFPFNRVGQWIGANDRIYGHERREKTDFIVTSGISDWAIKFKTGTKSEYVVIHLIPENL